MNDIEIKLVIAGFLHDIGKIIYRDGKDQRNHSISGYDFLKNDAKIEDQEILNAVRFHHAKELCSADIPNNSIAYITYMANNIASATERRDAENGEIGFNQQIPLASVFNILNGNNAKMNLKPQLIADGINNPSNENYKYDEAFYSKVKNHVLENFKALSWTKGYLNSLQEVMEANLCFIPSSTYKGDIADISLFDHVKLTAAISSCIYAYLQSKNITNYKEALFNQKDSKAFYNEKAFILYSMDISGIQSFIYTIATEKALKTLRSRSFYLEIMMEHMIDHFCDEIGLSRANLIYSGGGHCYILMPNTNEIIEKIKRLNRELNDWLLKTFDISLFVGYGYCECSSNDLKNEPNGTYAKVFQSIGDMLTSQKNCRYTPKQIIELNSRKASDHARECKVCRSMGKVDTNGVCSTCLDIENFSNSIINATFFKVTKNRPKNSLPLPWDCYLSMDTKEKIETIINDNDFVRCYGKNEMYSGKNVSTKLWVGDYSTASEFEKLAQKSTGIERIAIMRADVDNLGQTFVAGFNNPKNNNRYVTMTRTATLSRQLSMFFKHYINDILSNPVCSLLGVPKEKRNASIVYSGGDDVFLVGAWDDIIEASIDIKNALKAYTENTLTLSAGIGVYYHKYPISAIAEETAELEDSSKSKPGKAAITLFEDGEYHDENGKMISDGCYSWDDLETKVIKEKFETIKSFFDTSEEHGKGYLYKILELIRNNKEKINFARFIYLLARMEPNKSSPQDQKEKYRIFSENMVKWIKNSEDCRQLKTAITLYAYLNREKTGE